MLKTSSLINLSIDATQIEVTYDEVDDGSDQLVKKLLKSY